MPELPEIKAHAERLFADYGACTLSGFKALSFTALKTFSPRPDVAIGEPLRAVATRGKYLVLQFESAAFVVHLMQGGRLVVEPKPTAKPRGGLARWSFHERPNLLLREAGSEHRAGVWVVSEVESADLFQSLGPDADELTQPQLDSILAEAKGARVHGVLRDQRLIAGIGRRLANEICWTSCISPFAPCSKLDPRQRTSLLEAIHSTISDSLKDERSRDEMVSSKHRLSNVHHRSGQPCPRGDGDQIREISYTTHTVNYCATCQTKGKILADNTTSKFLK